MGLSDGYASIPMKQHSTVLETISGIGGSARNFPRCLIQAAIFDLELATLEQLYDVDFRVVLVLPIFRAHFLDQIIGGGNGSEVLI